MSISLYDRARHCIAQGALTNSKRPESLIKGVYPTHIVAAKGAEVRDERGKTYVDFICGLGSNLFGYGHPKLALPLAVAAEMGASHSLPTIHEVATAEILKEMFHWVDRWKFVKTGSEACSAAIKIARAVTGRYKIWSEGYHGWHETFASLVPPAHGCGDSPSLGIWRMGDLDYIDDSIAAIIVEPVQLDASEHRMQYLQELRKRCTEHGVLLIFDEIITGYRFPQWSVSRASNVTPDLILIGKAMANGMPLAAVGGKAEIMDDVRYFVSGTYCGEVASLCVAQRIAEICLKEPNAVTELVEEAQRFCAKLNELLAEFDVRIDGYGTRGAFVGNEVSKALFWQECCLGGVLFGPSFFYNYAHATYSVLVWDVVHDVIRRMKTRNIPLKGELPSSPFAAKARGK